MEKDDEIKGVGNSVDFGARIHDPRLGRFLSIDPRYKEFPFMSPYLFAANTPIQAIDENGEGPTFTNKKEAQRIADNVNAIFANQYKFDKPFLKVVTKTEVTTLFGFELWSEEKITFETNSEFDWNTDRYTKAFYNFVNMKEDVPSNLVPEWEEYRGSSKDSRIRVSGQAKDYSEETKDEWTVGGIYLHEALYHISTLGLGEYYEQEKKKSGTGANAANKMRNYYKLKTGDKHDPQAYLNGFWGDNSIIIEPEEQEQLDQERGKTGGEK